MASNGIYSLAFTTSVAVIAGSIVALKLKSGYAKLKESKEKELVDVVRDIKIEDIAALLNSNELKIRKSAEQLLIERAARRCNLTYIMKQCLSDDAKEVVKAVTAVYLLVKSSDYTKAKLMQHEVTSVLTKAISNISNGYDYAYLIEQCRSNHLVEKILSRCIASLFYLTLHNSVSMMSFSKEKMCIKEILINILGDHGYHISSEVKRWSTYVIHQMCQHETHSIKIALRQWGVIRKATCCLIKTLGDILQTQLCLQILVQYLSDTPVDEMISICKEMATLGVLPHLVGLLRSDEDEHIVQFSTFLIHHFCCFDIDIVQLSRIPGIVKILYSVLNSTEYSTQKTILRICNYLSVGSSKFRRSVLNFKPMLKKLSVCMLSSYPDVVHGSLMLVHDLAMPDKRSVEKLISMNPDIIKSLVKLSFTSKSDTVELVAETLGYFSSCESLHSLILEHGVVNAILHFAKSSDTGVQFWASAMLFNMSMISDQVKESIIKNGGISILLEMAANGDEVNLPDISINAAKTLVILGFLDSSVNIKLLSGLEASIIIDGTEYCPGKQGINVLSLDFINYKYLKGQVIQPVDFESFFGKHVNSCKSSNAIFIATQGDSTVLETGEQIPQVYSQFSPDDQLFLYSPAWCLVYTSQGYELVHDTDNIEFTTTVSLSEQMAVVLKEKFLIPFIDVLMAVPTTTTLCKSDELKLVEILARHTTQRETIVSTNGFLEYLNELIWSVSDLKLKKSIEPQHKTKVSHCMAALRIFHLCSIDKCSAKELIDRGLLKALTALLLSLIPSLLSKKPVVKGFNANEEKPAWFTCLEKTIETPDDVEALCDVDDDINQKLLSEMTDSNDVFLPANDLSAFGSARRDMFRSDNNGGESTPEVERFSRLRADSYILRSDSRTLDHQSTLEVASVFLQNSEQEMLNMPSRTRTFSISADHQQMRRISRTLSISLQRTKSDESALLPQIVSASAMTEELIKEILMILFHLINNNGNLQICLHICQSSILPMLYSLVGCFRDLTKKRMGLVLTSLFAQLNNLAVNTTVLPLNNVVMRHAGEPKSIIISPEGLHVTNENWYFETVCANTYVSQELYKDQSQPNGWYYEVVVYTEGIIQIGWAQSGCKFSPETAIGVGDNTESCAFDGARRKFWNGPSRDTMKSNDYGIEWQPDDVIGVLLSWEGSVFFHLNGKDLGPAVQDLDTSLKWYPAVSLSANQYCSFCFQPKHFRYQIPPGYAPVSLPESEDLSFNDPVELPRHLTNNNESVSLTYYFEVKVGIVSEHVVIGYLLYDPKATNQVDSVFETVKIELPAFTSAVYGCGICVEPEFKCFLTVNGEIRQSHMVSELLNRPIASLTFLPHLYPYVSHSNIQLNIGQESFVFEDANLMLYKQEFVNQSYIYAERMENSDM